MKTVNAIAAAVAMLMAACGASQGVTMPTTPVPAAPAATDPALDAVVAAARARVLVQRPGIPDVRVLSAEHVTWGSTSLGCPTKGMSGMDKLVRGFRVRLQAGDEVWDFHGDERGTLVLCPKGQGGEPVADPRI